MEYLAHIAPEDGRTQSVKEHLTAVATLAADFAKPFHAEDAAFRCGMLHDVGKYSQAFQKRIRGASIRVDHSTAGAVEAAKSGDYAAAFCIAGHHGGLPDRGTAADGSGDGTLMAKIKRRAGEELADYSAYADEVSVPTAAVPQTLTETAESAFFYTHMLFSALVDADWLDTERFMRRGAILRGTGEPLTKLSEKLDAYVSKWWASSNVLNASRCGILRALMDAGDRERGLYTLTVPTGGGKTVGSMAFALRHAIRNGQRRILYVIPYTSIIEQTQRVFEEIFGEENVVAHYANIEYKTDENGDMCDADRRRYLASENWDAPIILTTAVQFFESLFGNRPACCRKLHNIVESVVIFDEAQMLPINYLTPCVWSITELVKNYGCTAVLCTATQPALAPLTEKMLPGYTVRELCRQAHIDPAVFRRTVFCRDGMLGNDALAARLNAEEQVLCIVNSRKQAQDIFAMLDSDGSFHLSTAMYPQHRRAALRSIRERLAAGLPCRVISTSLVEAGVDVDFPCVYRALAGLDSVIQAAGRCNREGKRPANNSPVHIFETETKAPRSLEQAISAARSVLDAYDDVASSEAIAAYFNRLLYLLKSPEALDEKHIMRQIAEDLAFASVGSGFHLIESGTKTVYIPRGEGAPLTRQLLMFDSSPSRALMRKLGLYAVSVYDAHYRKLAEAGALQQVSENAAILLNMELYKEDTGLSLSPEGGEAVFF